MDRPAISVLYVTKRMGGFDLLFSNLERQTFRDFELIIVDELYEWRRAPFSYHLTYVPVDFSVVHLPVIGYGDGRQTTICRAHNIGYAACRGELVVLLQDYIWILPDGLERFWNAYHATQERMLITGHSTRVEGHPIANPNGILSTYDHWCGHMPPGDPVYQETRPIPQTRFAPITSEAWEGNWACVPGTVVEQLKGIDEDYDLGPASYDNQNLSQRAEVLGYQTTLDPENTCYGANHYRYFDDRPGARGGGADRSNMMRHLQRMWDIQSGMEPLVKQDYLTPWRGMRDKYGLYLPGGPYRV